MRVIHLTETLGYSGGAAQAFFLALKLRGKGIENYFAINPQSELGYRAKNEGFKIFDIDIRRNMDFKAAKRFSKIVDEIKPDIVHAHHPKAHNTAVLAKLLFGKRFALVVSRRVIHKLPRNIFARFKYRTSLVDAYIAVCEYVAKMLEDYGISKKKIFVVYSGVDRNVFDRKSKDIEFKRSLGLKDDDFVITLIGNFGKDKGHDVLIKALSLVEKKGFDFRAVFAGTKTDSNEIKDLFKTYVSDFSKGIFLGFRRDVERILNITDISINSAVRGEAVSGAIRESMACGLCCIASDIGGNCEIVKDGYNGFLFRVGDFKGLSEKIIFLMKNPNLRKKISENAYASITEKFSVERMAKETLDVYMSVLEKKGI
ncbi:MAG: glycosyltransferase family 4 protein [Elusimicrobiales bacterium]